MKKLLLILLFSTSSVFAARLENVKILSTVANKEGVELKLHANQGPKGSYFFVVVSKFDNDSFYKLALVIKKLEKRDGYKLDLEIPSFSMSPSGSYYRSESVNFTGYEINNSTQH